MSEVRRTSLRSECNAGTEFPEKRSCTSQLTRTPCACWPSRMSSSRLSSSWQLMCRWVARERRCRPFFADLAQLNDPDYLKWVALYLVASLFSILGCINAIPSSVPIFYGAFVLYYACTPRTLTIVATDFVLVAELPPFPTNCTARLQHSTDSLSHSQRSVLRAGGGAREGRTLSHRLPNVPRCTGRDYTQY